jgi:hypothetical protein
LFDRLKRLLRSKPRTLPVIEADDNGFSLTRDGHRRVFPWQSVHRIAAYKEDLQTTDQIVLLIETRKANPEQIAISENCPGFAELFGPMERELGLHPSWYLDIMTPAFAATPTVLYLRSMGDDE